MPRIGLIAVALSLVSPCSLRADQEQAAREALERATRFLQSISTAGGYVGIYSLDLTERFGEARYEKASPTQIWVQPPGTPTVGGMFLRAYHATGDERYLTAARDAGMALAWGQRTHGGWDHRVDVAHLTPGATKVERKEGHCAFDDDITQSAISFLMQLDDTLDEPWLTESIELALDFMIEAQFPNGAWPQWYPLRGGYHDYYTYNDNAINDCIAVMFEAYDRYHEPAYLACARRGADFIIASQLPAPQAGWAQQYSHDMKPAWARAFEPPGVCSAATSRNIRTLVDAYVRTGDEKYLGPIPAAIDWLMRSRLPADAISPDEVRQNADGGTGIWARLYEVGTNRPVYGDRENPQKMIYDVRDVSERELKSYGWQGTFGVPGAIENYERATQPGGVEAQRRRKEPASAEARRRRAESLEPRVRRVISQLDDQGRWVTGETLEIRSFVKNMNLLCEYLEVTTPVKE